MLKENPFPNEEIAPGPYKIGKNIEDAHVYRPAHPLAQRILRDVKGASLGEVEISFDYSRHSTIISALKPFKGKSGWLKISNLTVEAFEAEDHILVSAIDAEGGVVDPEVAKKMFLLSAQVAAGSIPERDKVNILEGMEQKSIDQVLVQIAERNNRFFDVEVDKLDKWSDDIKESLELELKKLSKDIKTHKTEARKIIKLDEKVKAQRQIKDMEKKRNTMRLNLFKLQDEADERKEKLIVDVEGRLKQKTQVSELFKIRWVVV